METIWKYELGVVDEQIKEMPIGAQILSVQVQNGVPCLWARVDPKLKLEERKLITHGTGHDVPETTGRHIGSYQLKSGMLVFHVFEGA